MGVNEKEWGGIVIDPNPKKVTIQLDIDMKTGTLKSATTTGLESKSEKLKRMREARGRKLGFIK